MSTGALRTLRNRNALLFVNVSLLTGFGGSLMSVAAGVWVMNLTDSSSLAALAGMCVYVPTLLGPVLGALVDRLPRQPLLIWTNLLTAGVLLSLLAVASAGQVWLIYAVMFARGVGYVLLDAGEAALLPAALPAGDLGDVNGLRLSAEEGMKLVAPLFGAGLFTWWGAHSVAALAAIALVCAAGLYALIRVRGARPEPQPRQQTRRIREGIRFLWAHPELRALVLVGATAIAMSGLKDAAVYAIVTADLHRPAAFVGVLGSGQGAGSILGGVLAGRLVRRHGESAVGALGAVFFAAGLMGQCTPWWPVAVVSSVVIGVGLPWTLVAAMTAIQRGTPEHLLGRVAATATTLLFAPVAVAIPAGAALVLVERHVPLVAAAIISLTAGVLLLFRLHPVGPVVPGERPGL